MKQKIDILMATYNGESFIRQQIASIQNQTMTDWVLYIHDDGSTDLTLEIIREFALQDERIVLIEDGISFHEPASNFMYLLKYVQSDYVIFSDQDDIWLENKLEVMYREIQHYDAQIPVAVYGNGYIYNSNSNEISGRSILVPPAGLGTVLFMNGGIQGCAVMMNRALYKICQEYSGFLAMHDHVVTLAAFTFGRMIYIDQKLMLYRRHNQTVTDVVFRNFGDKIVSFVHNRKPVIDLKHFKAIQAFYYFYAERMAEKERNLFLHFLKMEKMSRLRLMYTILRYPFNLYNSKFILLAKLFIRPFILHK